MINNAPILTTRHQLLGCQSMIYMKLQFEPPDIQKGDIPTDLGNFLLTPEHARILANNLIMAANNLDQNRR